MLGKRGGAPHSSARSIDHGGRADALTVEDLADLGGGARRRGRRRPRRRPAAPTPAARRPAAPRPATPVEGAEITIALGSEPTSLDPHLVDDGGERAINDNIYETLLTRTPDGELAPGLATDAADPGRRHDVGVHAARGRHVPQRRAVQRRRRWWPRSSAWSASSSAARPTTTASTPRSSAPKPSTTTPCGS